MDDALELADYLPLSFKNDSEQEYIKFLWESVRVELREQEISVRLPRRSGVAQNGKACLVLEFDRRFGYGNR